MLIYRLKLVFSKKVMLRYVSILIIGNIIPFNTYKGGRLI